MKFVALLTVPESCLLEGEDFFHAFRRAGDAFLSVCILLSIPNIVPSSRGASAISRSFEGTQRSDLAIEHM